MTVESDKHRKSLASMVRARLREKVLVKEPGKRRRVQFKRIVKQVWYELEDGYWAEGVAEGIKVYDLRPKS